MIKSLQFAQKSLKARRRVGGGYKIDVPDTFLTVFFSTVRAGASFEAMIDDRARIDAAYLPKIITMASKSEKLKKTLRRQKMHTKTFGEIDRQFTAFYRD
jgi:hypothetical protein